MTIPLESSSRAAVARKRDNEVIRERTGNRDAFGLAAGELGRHGMAAVTDVQIIEQLDCRVC